MNIFKKIDAFVSKRFRIFTNAEIDDWANAMILRGRGDESYNDIRRTPFYNESIIPERREYFKDGTRMTILSGAVEFTSLHQSNNCVNCGANSFTAGVCQYCNTRK